MNTGHSAVRLDEKIGRAIAGTPMKVAVHARLSHASNWQEVPPTADSLTDDEVILDAAADGPSGECRGLHA